MMSGAILLLAMSAAATPAAASCTPVPVSVVCASKDKCSGPLYEQAKREREQREAIEYARAMGQAVAARRDAAGLDRAYDLARLLMPNIAVPVDFGSTGGSCSSEIEDNDGGPAILRDAFEAELRRAAGLAADAPLRRNDVTALAHQRTLCNDEARRTLAGYLTSAIPAAKLRDAWDFLLPRAGLFPPADPKQALTGWRFTTFNGPDAPPGFHDVPAPDHIAGRRERAWHYLEHHPTGRPLLIAVQRFIASRTADPRGEAVLCPMTHAETLKMIEGLRK